MIHTEILYPEQKELFPLLKVFGKSFYLAGGTAISLQNGHRKSIDYDFFSKDPINPANIIKTLSYHGYEINRTLVKSSEEFTVIVNGVKCTFLHYPFHITPSVSFDGMIDMPSLMVLGAMKAYTLWRRSKWKDYVDLYFLFQRGIKLGEMAALATAIFNGAFNEKLFREQLCYFVDVDYTEEVVYLHDQVDPEIIRDLLAKEAISLH